MKVQPVGDGTKPATLRDRRKAERREQLLSAAAELIAERGFAGVRLEDLGSAVGVSGPAVYRHFPNKDALLEELLVGISQYLLAGGREVVRERSPEQPAIHDLIEFHLDFAFESPALIRIQDRDLASLPADARRKVRRTQREYVELWVHTLCAHDVDLHESDARIRAHAVFGLINSTPYSAGRTPNSRSRLVLQEMTIRALGLSDGPRDPK